MIIVLFFAFMFLVVLPIAFVWATVHEVRKNNEKKRLRKQADPLTVLGYPEDMRRQLEPCTQRAIIQLQITYAEWLDRIRVVEEKASAEMRRLNSPPMPPKTTDSGVIIHEGGFRRN